MSRNRTDLFELYFIGIALLGVAFSFTSVLSTDVISPAQLNVAYFVLVFSTIAFALTYLIGISIRRK